MITQPRQRYDCFSVFEHIFQEIDVKPQNHANSWRKNYFVLCNRRSKFLRLDQQIQILRPGFTCQNESNNSLQSVQPGPDPAELGFRIWTGKSSNDLDQRESSCHQAQNGVQRGVLQGEERDFLVSESRSKQQQNKKLKETDQGNNTRRKKQFWIFWLHFCSSPVLLLFFSYLCPLLQINEQNDNPCPRQNESEYHAHLMGLKMKLEWSS